MRLATVKVDGLEKAAIVTNEKVYVIEKVNEVLGQSWKTSLFELIQSGQLSELKDWYTTSSSDLEKVDCLAKAEVTFGPLYRHPRKIWGIGLNYVEHAADLSEVAPNTEPASFMKPDTTIIGPHDTILIPHQSERTTAESELGIIIGKECKNVSEEEAIDYVAGYTTIIDMTAEDILQRNPRYLTRSKSFDTFFSFGPELVTADEVDDVNRLVVSTMINGSLHRKNVVSNMTFRPWNLVSFHSKVMTLLPGDIISTGTPGAVVIRDGDVVACEIEGFTSLVNPVKDLKK
ncbi:2-keto-4-pentenoate hydratase/2-oxohepta-3-ene-1,7-dioic acid hydratase in catechol pathway [Bacillus oleivorans]|uniref:2-keto-4-pentenoate hydratase/2-oxohepta-3-ene-1,7-dioic acid hydratase in catechol pathway n=1 Tax=Bacillus oleivorans TaxID=1448271 RepID=A0A285CRP1_9BACI|nr:fumarylacetoacetate hydrolase family protein [Bacillus oleivorans]SNX69633.1 2-keto-4-pentenoate hydratase/2-oxohepta-3-ene-1,7-dioic acid hydratase in catechol pathway [Bacillus oleivorans]